MQPYEFGYRVGASMEKRALTEFGEGMLGTGSAMSQINPLGDPTQRGVIANTALYSNPFTGVPTAINDVGRHLYNGRLMDAGMAGLNGALSFIPGWGFAAKGVGRAIAGGGKQLARAGFTNTGKALTRGSQQFLNTGATMAQQANRGAGAAVQKVLPTIKNPGMIGKAYNAGVKNPLMAAPVVAPLALDVGSAAFGSAGPNPNFQPSGPGIYGGGRAGAPLASF